MVADMVPEYQAYLERFAAECGEVDVGSFTKYNGKLIKKLSADEFEPLHKQYVEAKQKYEELLDSGDTINDLVVKRVHTLANDLVITKPI